MSKIWQMSVTKPQLDDRISMVMYRLGTRDAVTSGFPSLAHHEVHKGGHD
jgi:hypothetical protein